MAIRPPGRVPKDLQTLLVSGRVSDLADGVLLERFLATRDEAAFEVLLERHGPMVLRVCLSALPDPDEAADAFQAVFLVLVRRAAAIRSRDSVAGWLHGVASRVSARAKVDAARRRKHERRWAESAPGITAECLDETRDATAALHEELSRLPERYREAVVLCCLERNTCEEAARRIGRPVGTVKARLSRARGLLKQRLLRRRDFPPTALVALGAEVGEPSPVPPWLSKATTLSFARNAAATARVHLLAEGVIGSMRLLRIKVIAVCSLTAALGAGTVLVAGGAPAPSDEPRTQGAVGGPTAGSAVEAPRNDPVRLALEQALPAATASADPYLMTFALIRLGRAQHASGDRAAALDTFVRADRVAGTVGNQHLRRLAIMRTAVARGRIGDAAPARATLERFAREGERLGPEARFNLMSMVIDFLFQAGFKDEARARLEKELAAVEAIDEPRLKEAGIDRLLYSHLTLGDYNGALRQAARYTDKRSNMRASMLQTVMTYHKANDARPSRDVVLRALELADDITYPYPRALAQRDIAAALARAGDIDGGLAVARNIGKDDPGPFQPRPSEVPLALAEIAREQMRAGARAAATETLREAFSAAQDLAQRDSLYSQRVRTVAETQAEVGDLKGAEASAAAIENDNVERALALVALARGKARAGDPAAAHGLLREAVAAARDIRGRANLINDDPAGNADRVFREAAVAQAETGDAKGALATVAGRGSDAWKSETLASIAPIRARLGDVDGALATAQSISEPTRAAEAYCSIASFQAASGDPSPAFSWASRLEAPVARAFALIGITEGLAARRSKKPGQEAREP